MTNNTKKRKILIVGSFPPSNKKNIYGGQLTACKTLIESEFSEKFKITTLNSSYFKNPPPVLIIRAYFAISRILELIYKLYRNKPSTIIIFIADKLSAYEKGLMILIAKKMNISIMIFPRAGALIDQYYKSKFLRLYLKYTFSKSNIFLCQGKSFQKFAMKELNFSKSKAPIIPNWTAKKEHLDIGHWRINNRESNLNNILFLGWLEDAKGIKEILESANILKLKNYNFHIKLAGDGSSKNYVNNFIKKNNLEEFISLVGWVNETQKKQALRDATIFLLPSWEEGFPNALVEAMSSGLACIVSNVGMIPDFIKDKQNCILIKPKNIQQIVTSLEKLFNDLEYKNMISENAYFFANTNFSIQNGSKLLSTAINKLNS